MKADMRVIWGVCLLMFGLGSSPAHAHRVGVFCWVEGSNLHTRSSFQPGGPVKGGQVQLMVPATGEVLATGTTDSKGQYTFHLPPRARKEHWDLRVVLAAGAGHQGQWDIPAADYVDGENPKERSLPADGRSQRADGLHTPQEMHAISSAGLQAILDRELDRKLAPIKRRLARMQEERFSVHEVVGGLGYFFGLLGLALYFKSTRRGRDDS
jgi:nickel transport protein